MLYTAFDLDPFTARKQFVVCCLQPGETVTVYLSELLRLAVKFGGMSEEGYNTHSSWDCLSMLTSSYKRHLRWKAWIYHKCWHESRQYWRISPVVWSRWQCGKPTCAAITINEPDFSAEYDKTNQSWTASNHIKRQAVRISCPCTDMEGVWSRVRGVDR